MNENKPLYTVIYGDQEKGFDSLLETMYFVASTLKEFDKIWIHKDLEVYEMNCTKDRLKW